VLAYSHPQRGQQDTDTVLKRWCSMFDYAYERVDSPVFVSVVHPQVIGQGHHMLMYEQFVEYIAGKEGVWFATCERSPTPGSPMTMIAGSSTCPTCAALRPLHPTLDGASPELSPGLIADAGSPSQGLPVTTGESQEPHLCTDLRTGAAEAAQAAFPVLPSDSITGRPPPSGQPPS
jgi:hypothetical protein